MGPCDRGPLGRELGALTSEGPCPTDRAVWERPEFPPIGIHITGARRPQLGKELDTAWVSLVGGGGRPGANSATTSPHLTPISLPHPPPPGPARPGPFVWPSRPLPAAATARPRVPRPVRPPPPPPRGTMRANVSGRAGRLCKYPTACENPPPPPRRPPPPERGGSHCIGMSCRPGARLGQSAIVCALSEPQPRSQAWGGRQRGWPTPGPGAEEEWSPVSAIPAPLPKDPSFGVRPW